MKSSSVYPIILVLIALSSPALAQVSELERLSGFAKHHKDNNQFDKARIQGERSQLEEEEQWENQKNRDLGEFLRTRKPNRPDEEGADARVDQAAKKRYSQEQEKDREVYVETKRKQQAIVREKLGLPSEAQELGLDDTRPRYDYKKRAYFGATPKYGKNGSSSSGSGYSGGSGGGGNYGSSPSFPPPPTFDDFGGDGGYVPAPNMPDDLGDFPPPPPPPPPSFGEDYNNTFSTPDFPPPPPPSFGEDGMDF